MRIVCTSFIVLVATLNFIEISSQSERLPDDGSDLRRHQSGPSSPSPRRDRSESPSLKKRFPSVLGYKFEDLELIRLFPHNNPNRTFELRKYCFPPDKPIRLRTKKFVMSPIPAGEQIVLSTLNGDVCALLEKLSNRNTVLRPIFEAESDKSKRVKINMKSGEVGVLTTKEIAECPVLSKELIAKKYGIFRINPQSESLSSGDSASVVFRCEPSSSNPSRQSPNPALCLSTPNISVRSPSPTKSPHRNRSRSPSLRQTSPNILGFKFEELSSIRLSPRNYPNRTFELRTYIFPLDEPIGLRTKNRVLNPMPTSEQVVLATSNGDVYAILEKLDRKNPMIRPIFTSILGISERVKINIHSGAVGVLTTEEIAECPLTSAGPMSLNYRVFRV